MAFLFAFIPVHAIIAIVTGHWILYPLVHRAGHLRLTLRVTITDVLCLMIMLQVALACFAKYYKFYSNYAEETPFWIWLPFLAILTLCTVALWGSSLCVASNARVVRPLRRIVLVLILIPGTLALMNVVPIALVIEGSWILERVVYWCAPRRDAPLLELMYGFTLLLVVALAAMLRCLAAWVVITGAKWVAINHRQWTCRAAAALRRTGFRQ